MTSQSASHRWMRTERRHVQTHLMDARNQHAQIVQDHLAQNLIDVSGVRLGFRGVTELRLDHGERRLDVALLEVAGEERVPLVAEQMYIRVHAEAEDIPTDVEYGL